MIFLIVNLPKQKSNEGQTDNIETLVASEESKAIETEVVQGGAEKVDQSIEQKKSQENTTTQESETKPITIDDYVGTWGADRYGWTVAKLDDNTVSVEYEGSGGASSNTVGKGTGYLQNDILHVDMKL